MLYDAALNARTCTISWRSGGDRPSEEKEEIWDAVDPEKAMERWAFRMGRGPIWPPKPHATLVDSPRGAMVFILFPTGLRSDLWNNKCVDPFFGQTHKKYGLNMVSFKNSMLLL
jgi:hypothetical protein